MADIREKRKEMSKKTMDDLWNHAEDDTWRRFVQLEKEGKLCPRAADDLEILRNARERDPKFSIRADDYKELAFYYFDERFDTPYSGLCVNRYPEDGQLVMMDRRNERRYMFGYNWPLENDLVYLKFRRELENSNEIELNNVRAVNREVAWRISRQEPRYEILHYPHVISCLEEALDHKYFKAASNFLFGLLSIREQVWLRTRYEEFLEAMNAIYKVRHGVTELKMLIKVFDGLARECSTMKFEEDCSWCAKMKTMIRAHLNTEQKRVSRVAVSRGDYMRMKIRLAKRIGIVDRDGTVELYKDIFIEDSDADNALQKLESLG